MSQRFNPFFLSIVILSFGLISFLAEKEGTADSSIQGEVLLDGLSVLVSEATADQTESIPVLLSDVEIEVSLLLARSPSRAEKSGRQDDEIRNEARRCVALVKMLARQSRRLGGTPDPKLVNALVSELTETVGGSDAIASLLKRFGSDEKDLRDWAEDAILAAEQIRYVEEQVDLPFDKALAVEAKKASIVSKWLDEMISRNRLRILR